MLPNFIVVGAAKCGTTSLFEYLREHPDVYVPQIKETSHFASSVPTRIVSFADYSALFANTGHAKAIGEASVAYLYDPAAPRNIADTLGPNTKIIIMLRDPVEMMHSLWGHMTRVGGETLSFSDALAAEGSRMADPSFRTAAHAWADNFAYRDRATYAPQIRRYIETFGRSNVLIVIYEQFFADPTAGYRHVCEFLGIATSHQPNFLRHNPAGVSRSDLIRDALNKPSPAKAVVKLLVPPRVRLVIRKAMERMNRKDAALPEIDASLRRRLDATFRDDAEAVALIVGQPLSPWWNAAR